MNVIIIEVHYEIYGSKAMRAGEFRVNSRLYEQFPDLEAAKVAKKWVNELQKQYGYEMKLEEVLYEGKDITHLVIDPEPKNEELPF